MGVKLAQTILIAFALALPLSAQESPPAPAKPERGDSILRLPGTVHGLANTFVTVQAVTNCKMVRWLPLDAGLQIVPSEKLKDPREIIVLGPPGSYRVLAYTALGDVPSEPSITVVVLGSNPGPGPGPAPPGPDPPPGPGPAPIPVPVAGFRVILVYETMANNTQNQLNIIFSPVIAEYLNRKTVKDSKGKPEWQRWDKDVDVSNKSELWRSLWMSTKPQLGTLPAIVIVTDAKGLVFPLPATEKETMDLLKKYGGE